MLMRVLIGNGSKCGLYVEFLNSDGKLLEKALGTYYNARVSDRSIVFVPTLSKQGEFLLTHLGAKNRPRMTHVFKQCSPRGTHWANLPAFELMEFELKENNGELSGLLPPDHQLPWPSKRSLMAMTDEQRADFCEEAVLVRCLSLVASGLAGFTSDMALPGHIREVAPGAFARSMKAARDLNGICQ